MRCHSPTCRAELAVEDLTPVRRIQALENFGWERQLDPDDFNQRWLCPRCADT